MDTYPTPELFPHGPPTPISRSDPGFGGSDSSHSLYLPRIGGSTDPPADHVGAKKVHQVTSELGAGVWGGEFGDRRKGHASDRISSTKLGTESRKMMKQEPQEDSAMGYGDVNKLWAGTGDMVGIGGHKILSTKKVQMDIRNVGSRSLGGYCGHKWVYHPLT